MFSGNRAYGCAGFDDSGAQISNRNDKKVKQILNLCFKRIWDLGETKTPVYNILTKNRDLLLSYKIYHINAFLIYNKVSKYMPLIIPKWSSRDKKKHIYTLMHKNPKTKLNTKYTRYIT